MLGLISFLSTTVFFSPVINLLLLPVAFYRLFLAGDCRGFGFFRTSHWLGIALLFMSACLSISVFLLVDPLVGNFEKSLVGGFPYLVLILVSLFVGSVFRKRDLIVVLFLIFVEILVGFIEYVLGVHSFFAVNFTGQTQIGETELLYYNRVFGLSLNSSVYAFKVLVGFVILMALKQDLTKRFFFFCSAIVVVGLVTSFNRTAIIAVVISLFFRYVTNWRFLLASFAGCGVVGIFFLSSFVENLTRGRGEVDFSGRDIVFGEFMEVFNRSPFFGNASQKVWLNINDNLYHAHSSYLEFLTSNGIFISLLFFSGYYLLILRGRILVALPLLVYSIFQYGLLWGLVFHDVVFSGLMLYLLKSECEANASRLMLVKGC